MRARRKGLALAGLVALAACDALPGKPVESERYRRPSEILDFASLYATNCSGCHGAQGRLGPARTLADPLYLALVGEERARRIVAQGVPGTTMPAFAKSRGGTLTDAQVAAVSRGLFDAWAKPVQARLPPYAATSPGRAGPGKDAYARFCAGCHGEGGGGGEKGGPVLDPDLLALVSDQMLRTTVIAGRPDLGMPDWREASEERAMTPREIADVVAFMSERRR